MPGTDERDDGAAFDAEDDQDLLDERDEGEVFDDDVPAPAATVGDAALAELRRHRQAKRRAQVNRFDALYQAYVTAFVCTVAVLYLSTLVGDQAVDAAGLAKVLEHGPALLGLLAAFAVAIGLRSGARGGPVAVEPAEVRYVLLAPIDRRRALRSPALKQIRFALFAGVVAGAGGGLLAHRRLGQTALSWIASGAVFGALLALLLLGTALVANGARLRSWLATLLGGGILAWAVADLAGVAAAPTTTVGSLALWPIRFDPEDLLAVVAAVAAVVVGLVVLGRGSLELAERRTVLVGQLRFAATLQDLRTVILLRRQLAQELPRQRPWIRVPGHGRFVLWRRGWRGLLRFPGPRLGRVALLTAGVTAALLATVHGTTPMVIVSGMLAYVLGLDLIEPLAQEVDHTERAERLPVEWGMLLLRHLPASAVAAVLCAVVGGAVAVAAEGGGGQVVALAALVGLPAALGGLAGATVSTVQGAPGMGTSGPSTTDQVLPPEVAGMRIVFRAVWPVVVSIVGSVPALQVANALTKGRDPVQAAVQGAMLAGLFCGLTAAWVRFREPARVWFRQAMEESKSNAKERQSATAASSSGRSR